MTRHAAKSWATIRSQKVAPDQEPAVAAGVRALRDALTLRELRSERGITQVELADRLGKTQGSVSELERRDDWYLSSLREYIEALGGRLQVAAVFEEDGETNAKLIDLMSALEASVQAARNARAHDIPGGEVVVRTQTGAVRQPAAARRTAKSA